LHIVIGEQVPKSIAIRRTEASALLTALPMRIFYYIFIVPLWILNSSVSLVLRILRIRKVKGRELHSEGEVRMILEQSQESGMISFRRLLLIENVLELGDLKVRNAMRVRKLVQCLNGSSSTDENEKVIGKYRYSRYPFMPSADADRPSGFIHVKDLFLSGLTGENRTDMAKFVHPPYVVHEDDPLEQLLAVMQRKALHMAMVEDKAGQWTGIITMEDVMEEVLGIIEEEYPTEEIVYLSDHLAASGIFLDVRGSTVMECVKSVLDQLPKDQLPLPEPILLASISERERIISSYVGKSIALPHARFESLQKPVVLFARLGSPIPSPVKNENIEVLFILLTPFSYPRIHQILLSRIAGMLDSDFFEERLHTAGTTQEIYEAVKVAEQTILD
jgi:Mg2+/Co2+ transporter CorC